MHYQGVAWRNMAWRNAGLAPGERQAEELPPERAPADEHPLYC